MVRPDSAQSLAYGMVTIYMSSLVFGGYFVTGVIGHGSFSTGPEDAQEVDVSSTPSA